LAGIRLVAEDVSASVSPAAPSALYDGIRLWAAELRELFAAYVEAKQSQNVLDYDDLLLYWAQIMADRDLAAAIGAVSIMSWLTSVRTPTSSSLRSF
jgi:superfamily I DNA/RNA helicase